MVMFPTCHGTSVPSHCRGGFRESIQHVTTKGTTKPALFTDNGTTKPALFTDNLPIVSYVNNP